MDSPIKLPSCSNVLRIGRQQRRTNISNAMAKHFAFVSLYGLHPSIYPHINQESTSQPIDWVKNEYAYFDRLSNL